MTELWDETETVANQLSTLLKDTQLYEPVDVSVARKEVQMMGRVHKDKERDFVYNLCKPLLIWGKKWRLNVFIGKQYFLHGEESLGTEKLVHGWTIAINGAHFLDEKVLADLFEVIKEQIPVDALEVIRQPILATKSVIQKDEKSKGARPVMG